MLRIAVNRRWSPAIDGERIQLVLLFNRERSSLGKPLFKGRGQWLRPARHDDLDTSSDLKLLRLLPGGHAEVATEFHRRSAWWRRPLIQEQKM